MSKFLMILLSGVIVLAITFITVINGLLPAFLVPFVLAIYSLSIVYVTKE